MHIVSYFAGTDVFMNLYKVKTHNNPFLNP